MKRFYKTVTVEQANGGWAIALDGRRVRTQGGCPQAIPSRALAEMLASEWEQQGETIDSASFRYRDMVDYALDVVSESRDATIDKLLSYGETDTLCYRADPDEPLHRRQQEVWEPLLAAFEAREGVSFTRVSGVMHREQPPATLDALRARLAQCDSLTLAALESMASLTASLIIALAALEPGADGAALWDAANLEEDWQVELWGEEPGAAARRKRRRDDFLAAIGFARVIGA